MIHTYLIARNPERESWVLLLSLLGGPSGCGAMGGLLLETQAAGLE